MPQVRLVMYNNADLVSQVTLEVPIIKPNRLMTFREGVIVHCQNHTKHTFLMHSVSAVQTSVMLKLVVRKVTMLL
jgi:hypothetical protein